MNADFNKEELHGLFAALNEGTLSPEDHARLERILTASAEARQLWFLHSDIETGIADWAAMRRAAKEQTPVLLPSPAAQVRQQSRQWFLPLAAAAALMLGTVWWVLGKGRNDALPEAVAESKVNGVALLARAVGVEWEGPAHAPGSVLEAGTLRLKSGAALVEFYGGARLIVEGPAEVRLVSAGEAFVQSGRVNAHVPPQAVGFTVGSPTLRVVDHGTDFGMNIQSNIAPEVHVFQGKVEVAATNIAPRALQTGEALRLDAGAIHPISAVRSSFVTEDELTLRVSALGLQRLADWREAAHALSADAATIVHFRLDEAGERSIPNQSPKASPDSHGSIVGGAWTEGRWPEKNALQFRSESDRIRFTAAQPLHTFTLLAWVRVDSLPRWQNVLLCSDSTGPGALRWHLTKTGELRLEIARDLGRRESDWEAVNSAPFITAERFGQWHLLATTFDGKTIRHFADGQPIGSGASFTPPEVRIGTAELANWRGDTKRQLAAALDEFAIISRAMSPEEMRIIFESGRP